MHEPIKLRFGWSAAGEAKEAGGQAARAALIEGEKAGIALLFSTVGYDAEVLLGGTPRT